LMVPPIWICSSLPLSLAISKPNEIPIDEISMVNNSKPINIKQALLKGPLIIKFIKGGWCDFCKADLIALNEVHQEFQEAGATVWSSHRWANRRSKI